MAAANYDPHLGSGPSEDSEILLDDSDSGSVLSDDSVLPDYEAEEGRTQPAKTLYEACVRNDPASLRRILARGVTREEAMELDINGRVRRNLGNFVASALKYLHQQFEFFLPGPAAERTYGGCGKGLHRHRHHAAHLPADRHQPSRQRRQHGGHDCRSGRLVPPEDSPAVSLRPESAMLRNIMPLISLPRFHHNSELHC